MDILTTWDAREEVQLSGTEAVLVTVTAEEFTYDSEDEITHEFVNKVLTDRTCQAKLNKDNPNFNTIMRMLLKKEIRKLIADDVVKQGVNTEILKVSYKGLQNYVVPEA